MENLIQDRNLVERVVNRYAKEFPTEEARAQYLKDHPGADKAKHTVKKTEPSEGKGKEPEEGKKEEKPESKDYKHNVSSVIQNASYKTGIPKENLEKLSEKMRKQPALHPNKAAFDYLFPKAKGFNFSDLDFSHGKDELEKWGITKEDETKYRELASHLGKISKIHLKEKKMKTASDPRQIFEHALLVNRVASRYCEAIDFPNEEALKEYLKKHPKADKSKHTVMKKEEGSEKKPGDKSEPEEYESVTGGGKHKSIPDRLKLLEKHPKHTVEEYGEYDDLPVGVGDDLIRISGSHLKKVIHKLSKLPMAILKKRHTFIGKQIETARSQHDDKTVKNLQEIRKHIERAADKKDEEIKK